MTADQQRQQRREYSAKLTLIGLFLAIFAAFAPKRGERREGEIRPLDLAMLSLATVRTGRLIAYDLVTEPVREPFTETEPDASGAGDTIVPQGSGVQGTLGELISCPICIGTWAAAAMAYALRLAPAPTRLFLAIMSASGLAEILNELIEALSWTGQAERKQVGDSNSND